MPDFTTHYAPTCPSNLSWSKDVAGSRGKTYTVSYGFMPHPHPVQYDWSCSCDAYKYGRGKPCKHIEAVKASGERCGWNGTLDLVEPAENHKCPCCGEKVEYIPVAV